MDSFTGDKTMRWVGHKTLPDDTITVPRYRAAALAPALTPRAAARALGLEPGVSGATGGDNPDTVGGNGWAVTVQQSDYATRVTYQGTCGTLTSDPDKAAEATKTALSALGGDPKDWSWFTILDENAHARTIGEPNIEGVQTWATGSFAALVDESGVCAANAVLMQFDATGESDTLPSAYDTFHKVRHTEGLPVEGDYESYEQTWTLESEGVLIPLWRFTSEEHSIVAVDFGDGLETAYDTETVLRQNLASSATAAPRP